MLEIVDEHENFWDFGFEDLGILRLATKSNHKIHKSQNGESIL